MATWCKRVDNAYAGQGLLNVAVLRSLQAAQLLEARALLCLALNGTTQTCNLKHSFHTSTSEPLTVMLGLRNAP